MIDTLRQSKEALYMVVARYFLFWSRLSLRRWKPRVVVVTGSAGKTTMLRMLEQALGARAHYSHDANSIFGIAFDILELRPVDGSRLRWLWLALVVPLKSLYFRRSEEFYVAEVDGGRPLGAELPARLLKPEVSIWVSLGRSHPGLFDGVVRRGKFASVDQAIAHEFGAVGRHTSQLVIADGDNPDIRQQLEGVAARVEYVSGADLAEYQVWPDRTEFRTAMGTVEFACPMPRVAAEQILMAQHLLKYLGVEQAIDMSGFVPAPGRNNYFDGQNGLKLIDSSYNAHLISMQSIIGMFDDMQAEHKWLVVGDIIEQGASEAEEHHKLGQLIAEVELERYILVGRRMTKYAAETVIAKWGADSVKVFATAPEALAYIQAEATGAETILFKGSQFLEWIVEKLLKNPDDRKLLPRQDQASVRHRRERGMV